MRMVKKVLICFVCLCSVQFLFAQGPMQKLEYKMKIDFKADRHLFSGYQHLSYTNTSPDTLHQLFYQLFYNAFQRGSEMESRANSIRDQDGGLLTKFLELKEDKSGYQQIDSIKIDGSAVPYTVKGTVLIVTSTKAVAPQGAVAVEIWFHAQVPGMIMRSGRDNAEQVAYTMTQWYPKICMYDRAGWHPEEYIHREFFGPFADFDVQIRIDSSYMVAATGVLQNPEYCGHGYAEKLKTESASFTEWHFQAKNVHDFAWAADIGYTHLKWTYRTGLKMHCFFKKSTATVEDWNSMAADLNKQFDWMENKVGPYPYPVYSLVQGGSGGTEYPMLAMIYGKRPVSKGMSKGHSIQELAIHEVMHNWWYGAVANDETRNAWLDEGFALFFQYEYQDALHSDTNKKAITQTYDYLLGPMRIHALEPMGTPSEYYDANWSYDASVYHKGAVFLNQLRYIVGSEAFWRGIRLYYKSWSFGHPDGDDFILCMEKTSGLQLKWYLDLWTKTNKNIDYAITKVETDGAGTKIFLRNKDQMPMPIDLRIYLKDHSVHDFSVPLTCMYGNKKTNAETLPAWSWTAPVYEFKTTYKIDDIAEIEIDPEKCLIDIHPEDNRWKPGLKHKL